MTVKRAYKNLLISIVLAVFLITGFLSCATNQAPAIPDIHTPEISMSWPGTYTGIIPAADGPGIEVELTLNSARTFALQYRYIDRDNVFLHEGTFTWDNTGRIIILDIENIPPYYLAAEGRLIQLDMQGNSITGDLAEHYILEKIRNEE
jgi:uncharacterized lipoprotein NlpE involved in copper resistance